MLVRPQFPGEIHVFSRETHLFSSKKRRMLCELRCRSTLARRDPGTLLRLGTQVGEREHLSPMRNDQLN